MKLIFTLILFFAGIGYSDDYVQHPQNDITNLNGLYSFAKKFQAQRNILFSLFELKALDHPPPLPCKGVFTASFIRDGKRVTFIAINQVDNPSDPYTDKDLKNLEKAIQEIKPDGLLIDTPTNEFLGKADIQKIKKNCYNKALFLCGVPAYAALVGENEGTLIYGGEPPKATFDPLLLKRISYRDLLYYRSIQTLLDIKRHGIPKQEWEAIFNERMDDPAEIKKDTMNFKEISTFIEQDLKSTPDQVSEQWLKTTNYNNANNLQKISYLVDFVRDPILIKRLQHLLNRTNNVAIVYSPIHYYNIRNVIFRVFGPPTIKCLDK